MTQRFDAPSGAARPPALPRPAVALGISSVGFFLITLDILIVNLALPRITQDLGGSPTARQWVIDSYTLLFASLLLLGGNLADRAGAKRVLATGTAVFAAASVACAVAPTMPALIAGRIVQGSAAAAMLPASMALIREAYPDARARAKALGIWAVGGAIAGMVGPPVGGTLASVDWRLVFGINVPACVAMLVLLLRVRRSATHPARFDWVGQVLAGSTLGALVGSLIEGAALGYASPIILGGFGLTALTGSLFVWSQARSAHPMMPLSIFRPPPVRLALALGFVFMVSNFGTSFLLSLYLQQELGLGPLQAGFLFLLSPAFSITGNLVSGPATNRLGARMPILIGMGSMALGVFTMAAVAPLRIPLLTMGTMILTGFGGALAMPPTSGLVLANVPPSVARTASAVFNTFRQVGGAVAIAVFGALVAGPGRFLPGMQISLVATGGLLVLVVVATAITLVGQHTTPALPKPQLAGTGRRPPSTDA